MGYWEITRYLVMEGLMVCCFWAAATNSLAFLIASRLVLGFCIAPFEALVPASIADVWFVHQKGYRSSIFNLGVLGGINLAAPISGDSMQYLGYRNAFWIMGAFFAVVLIMVVLFMPETVYHPNVWSIHVATRTGEYHGNGYEKNLERDAEVNHIETSERAADLDSTQREPYWKTLKPYSGYNSDINYSVLLIRLSVMLLSPSVAWGTLLFTTSISWLVGISITLSQIFSAPPYNFSIKAVGACNLSAFVATVIGVLVAAPLLE